MQEIIDHVSAFISSLLILPLIGTGIYLTIRMKLVQLLHFGHSWKVIAGVYDNPEDEGDINHFQALSAALSATIGIGNIAGVATAIHFGGPGALFWMWVTAFVGMATKFGEASLALLYREIHEDGSASGGPMYYIEMGLGKSWKPLAMIFAFCAIISSFGSGNTVQAFTVADSFRGEFGIPAWLTGIVMSSLIALVILGGIKRIGVVASRLVPFMALVYVVSAVVVLIYNRAEIPAAFNLIFSSAFTAKAGIGGFAGSTFGMALLWGVRRGLFSNESGQGSAPIAHAAAKTDEPVREGTVAMIGPFIDTLVICTLTGLTIITSGAWNTPFPTQLSMEQPTIVHVDTQLEKGGTVADSFVLSGDFEVRDGTLSNARLVFNNGFFLDPKFGLFTEEGVVRPISEAVLKVEGGSIISVMAPDGSQIENLAIDGKGLRNGSLLTSQAFQRGLGSRWGSLMVTLGVFLFAISTAISWSYYGDRATVYLFGLKGVVYYRIAFVLVNFVGATLALKTVWGFGDIALSFMAFPNLIALIFLAPKLQKAKEEYFSRKHKPYGKAHW
ncbi:sodium:alanine symporter family protein [bacterium]|nr:sodium:alanine symporter family protein [bacterium]